MPPLRDPASRIQSIKTNIGNLVSSALVLIKDHGICDGIQPPSDVNAAVALHGRLKRDHGSLINKVNNFVSLANEWRSLRAGNEELEAQYVKFVEEEDINAKREEIDQAIQTLQISLEEAESYKQNLTREHVACHTPVGEQPSATPRGRPPLNPRLQAFFNNHNGPPSQEQHTNQQRGNNTPTQPEFQDELNGQSQNSNRVSNVGRRKLEPLVFTGDFLEYASWKKWFLAAYDVPELNPFEKSQYLTTMVSGEAADAIRGIELQYFQDIMDALDTSYDRPDIVRRILLQKAREIRPNKGLRQFIRDIKVTRRQMAQNDLVWDSPLAVQELEEKLPVELMVELARVKWAMNIAGNVPWNMDALIQALEGVERMLVPAKSAKTAATLATTVKPSQQNRYTPQVQSKLPCLFCEEYGHSSLKCPRTTTLTQRRQKLQALQRCFRCLAKDHQSRQCAKKCKQCDGAHHRLICAQLPANAFAVITAEDDPDSSVDQTWIDAIEKELDNELNNEDAQEANGGEREQVESATFATNANGGEPEQVESATFATNSSESCFITAARVPFRTKEGDIVHAACLLDSDSDTTFVNERLAAQLRLPQIRTVSLATKVLGDAREQEVMLTRLTINTSEGDVSLPAYIVPSISSPMILRFWDNNAITKERTEPMAIIDSRTFWTFVRPQRSNRDDDLVDSTIGTLVIPKRRPVGMVFTTATEVTNMWSLQTLGINEPMDSTSVDDTLWKRFNETTTTTDDGRLEVRWLWNGKQESLPSNFDLAFRRTKVLMDKLERTPELLMAYRHVLDEQLQNNVIEPATKNDGPVTHYLPHQIVVKAHSSSTKLRLVYDASAGTTSLNDCLHTGPLTIPPLLDLLFRFRTNPVVVLSDITKAFLQLALPAEERDAVRFLTKKDWNKPFSRDNLQVWRFRRVCFGVRCSPSLLMMSIRRLLENGPMQHLLKNIYVDNFICTYSTPERAVEETRRIVDTLRTAKFELTQFSSNIPQVEAALTNQCSPTTIKVLGMQWNPQEDHLRLQIQDEQYPNITKRLLLSRLASVFDPLGILAPLTLKPKLMVQELWKQDATWDQQLGQQFTEEWNNWEQKWSGELTVPRQFPSTAVQLHVFVDASAKAFAAVAYLGSTLVIAKNHLAPQMARSADGNILMPRMELMALLIGTRIANTVRQAIDTVTKATVWSDSTIALQQIVGQDHGAQPVFVRNRLTAIRRCRDWIEFRHVSGTENPADVATRGCDSFEELRDHALWWSGPPWLSNPAAWPSTIVIPAIPAEPQNDPPTICCVTVASELEDKIRDAQKTMPPTQKQRQRFRLFSDDKGLICVPNRLLNSEWHGTPTSIWIPARHQLANELADDAHSRMLHCGPATLFAELRRQFFVPYSVAARAAQRCKSCRHFDAKPYATPQWAPLPPDRVNPQRPFQSVGVDFAGPFRTQEGELYVLIIACATTRAVHCECTKSLSTEDMMIAWDKFEARRGLPDLVRSDNAKTFELAANILQKRHQTLQWRFITPRAAWKGALWERMIAPLKRSIKRTICNQKWPFNKLEALVIRAEAVVNHRPLYSPQSMASILRPIDFLLPAGVNSVALQPAQDADNPSDPEWVPADRLQQRLQKLKGKQESQLNKFWSLWSKAYLQSLVTNNRENSNAKCQATTPIIGEPVIIHEEDRPRSAWQYGTIKKSLPDADGIHRVATIALPNGKELQRALPHLYPLELHQAKTESDDDDVHGGPEDKNQSRPVDTMAATDNTNNGKQRTLHVAPPEEATRRPGRDASRRAKSNIKGWAATLLALCVIASQAVMTMGQRPFVCPEGGKTVIWTPPPIFPHCQQGIQLPQQPATAKIFERNRATFSTEATRCRLKSEKLELWTDPDGRPHTESQKVAPETPITSSECHQMREQKRCRFGEMKHHEPVWKTTNDISNDDYPNRFYSLVASRTLDRRNCLIDYINIYATHHNTTPFAADATLDDCQYAKGKCRVSDEEMLIWEPDPQQAEEFLLVDEVSGFSDGHSFTDPKNGRRFTFKKKHVLISEKDAILTDQGFAVIVTTRTSRGTGEEWATREQYAEYHDYLRTAKVTSHFCELTEQIAGIIRSMTNNDPLPVIRKIFKTNAVKIRQVAEALYEVQICTEIDVRFVPTEECRTMPPVVSIHLANSTNWVMSPRTLEVVEKPPQVARCEGKVIMRVNDSYFELDAPSGSLHEIELQKASPAAVEILEGETVILDWEASDGDIRVRKMIQDLHHAAEVNKQIGPVQRTSTSMTIEETVTESLIPSWFWGMWYVIVTLVVVVNILQFMRWAKEVTRPKVNDNERLHNRRPKRPQRSASCEGQPPPAHHESNMDYWSTPITHTHHS